MKWKTITIIFLVTFTLLFLCSVEAVHAVTFTPTARIHLVTPNTYIFWSNTLYCSQLTITDSNAIFSNIYTSGTPFASLTATIQNGNITLSEVNDGTIAFSVSSPNNALIVISSPYIARAPEVKGATSNSYDASSHSESLIAQNNAIVALTWSGGSTSVGPEETTPISRLPTFTVTLASLGSDLLTTYSAFIFAASTIQILQVQNTIVNASSQVSTITELSIPSLNETFRSNSTTGTVDFSIAISIFTEGIYPYTVTTTFTYNTIGLQTIQTAQIVKSGVFIVDSSLKWLWAGIMATFALMFIGFCALVNYLHQRSKLLKQKPRTKLR